MARDGSHTPKSRSLRLYDIGGGLTLRVPVVQAPLGACDGVRLAAAVSRAGGLGCLTVHGGDARELRRRLLHVRALTRRPVLLAFTAQWQRDDILDTALSLGFRHFQVFWWNGPRLAPRIKAADGVVFWQAGTVGQAVDALEVGADVIVAQGTDAGGQVRSPRPVRELVAELRSALGEELPIVAGGGLADRADVASVLACGAHAAMLGTRFLLSEESAAAPRHKARLLRATARDLSLDPRLVGDWPCAPRRRVLTARDEDVPALFAGTGVLRIRRLAPAGELVRSLAP
jgi:NAD(P)H-dependent flavin oxidoreductase YrpB (nitropropane dioxygenase family)